jgi:cell division septation protein DedD
MKPVLAIMLVVLGAAACDRRRDEPPAAATRQAERPAPPPADTAAPIVDPELGVPGVVRPGDSERRAAAEPTTPTAVVPVGARLYTVQVAAFRDEASARALEQRLRQQGVPVWTARARVGDIEFTRVRVGATGSLAEARRLGQHLRQQYSWPIWVDRVRPDDRPPADAQQATRTYIGG